MSDPPPSQMSNPSNPQSSNPRQSKIICDRATCRSKGQQYVLTFGQLDSKFQNCVMDYRDTFREAFIVEEPRQVGLACRASVIIGLTRLVNNL